MFKKTISILMAIVFVLSLMPLGALADVAGETTPVEKIINFTRRNYYEHQRLY